MLLTSVLSLQTQVLKVQINVEKDANYMTAIFTVMFYYEWNI